jgi:acyl transferase domain-containing protein/acyl carrier protein
MTSIVQKIEVGNVDPENSISEFGFDSIAFTELCDSINNKYNITMMPSVLFEHSTLNSLAKYLVKEYKQNIIKSIGYVKTPEKETKGLVHILEQQNEQRTITDYVLDADRTSIETKEPVAIIGISGIMPGSEDLDEFWENILAGKDLISEIPKERWDWEEYYGDPFKDVNKTNIKWGGFMKNVDKFDPLFFGISPREAELMDPQQRIFLKTVWQLIEDAGYSSLDIANTNTGVFVGVGTTDYSDLLNKYNVEIKAQTATGTCHAILANRISYLLDLRGPSEAIDTACSSSLVAIHSALESIKLGNCEMAIAGGVNVLTSPKLYISLSKSGVLCEDGRCKTFDKNADGYVRGEGAGAILLKPLSKAVEDGDHIYAIIKGSHVNHGGHVNSLTTPNPNAQAELIVSAWEKSGINPSTIDYIETHGTGTKLGDPIEINGLKKAFKKMYKHWNIVSKSKSCGLGSVKTNIGHLETAAGIAGLLKTVLAMKYEKIPANINFNELNPYIELEESPLYLVNSTKEWVKENNPRRAGVSSFGFGGTNVHIILEEYEASENINTDEECDNEIIVLSAKNEEGLKNYANKIVDFISKSDEKDSKVYLKKMAYTLQVGRDEMPYRLATIVRNKNELRENLIMYLEDKGHIKSLYIGIAEKTKKSMELLIDRNNLNNIAKGWVLGNKIDWKRLYEHNQRQRISLPTYPFANESYWISNTNNIKDKEKDALLYYKREWEVENIIEEQSIKGNILVFCASESDKNSIKEYINDEKLIFVDYSDTFITIDEKNYSINPEDEKDYMSLFKELKQKDKSPDKIICLWTEKSKDNLLEHISNIDDTEKNISKGIKPIFNIIQGLNKIKIKTVKNIVTIFSNEEGIINPYYESIHGYSKSIKQVMPRLDIITVQLENEEEHSIIKG